MYPYVGSSPSVGYRRGWLIASVIAIFTVFLLHGYIRIFSTVAFGYLYWLHPSLEYVSVDTPEDEQLPVPKLLHQTWRDKQVPEKWQAAQQSCINAHPDYTYKLWTDEEGLKLIEEEYPWFLKTYTSYPYNIQRVDAVRYFILHKYGGVYIDLDMGCKTKLDFMRRANFTAPLTYPVGISNDIMAAAPNSPFMEQVIKRLSYWNRWLFIKYIQVMFSTGPMFLTNQYALASKRVKQSVAAIPPPLYGKYVSSGESAAFYHLHGSSWHADDAVFIFWIDHYKFHVIAIVAIFLIAGAITVYRKRNSMGESMPVMLPTHHKQLDAGKTI